MGIVYGITILYMKPKIKWWFILTTYSIKKKKKEDNNARKLLCLNCTVNITTSQPHVRKQNWQLCIDGAIKFLFFCLHPVA
jgi:hypothetical protein